MARAWRSFYRQMTVADLAEYESIRETLRPAQLGLILRGTTRPTDVVATLLHLSAREIVAIAEAEGRFTLTRRTTPAELRPYEARLLDDLFGAGPEIQVAALSGFRRTVLAVGRLLEAEDGSRWFADRPWVTAVRLALGVGGLAFLTIGVSAPSTFISEGGAASTIVLGGILVGLVMLAIATRLPRARTEQGRDLRRRALEFGRSLRKASTPLAAARFSELLPYTLVFGMLRPWVEVHWTGDAAARWYVGSARTAREFSRDLETLSKLLR